MMMAMLQAPHTATSSLRIILLVMMILKAGVNARKGTVREIRKCIQKK
jgi:hypothetical protein